MEAEELFEIVTSADRGWVDTWSGLRRTLHKILTNQEAQMASVDDLNAALAQLQSDVQALSDRIAALGSGTVDVPQGTLDTVTAIDQQVQGLAQPPAPAQ